MRIIKLSSNDIDFPDRLSVNKYFEKTLPNRNPVGQFLFTKGRISDGGIEAGETLLFSYKTKITHLARSASGRLLNRDGDHLVYPYYFIVDMNTLTSVQDIPLIEVEDLFIEIGIKKTLVRTQCWPSIPDSIPVQKLWESLCDVCKLSEGS